MSMQNEGKDVKESSNRQGMPDGADSTVGVGEGDIGAAPQPGAGQGSQQAGMPPSKTDDDQYDQGTVRRAP